MIRMGYFVWAFALALVAIAAPELAHAASGTPPAATCAPSALFCVLPSDISANWVKAVFPDLVIFAGETVPAVTGPQTVFASALQVMNSGALAIGSLLLTYKLFAGIVQTANDGEVLGKRWSTFWGPVRVASAAALIVPTASGYCLAQAIVVAIVLTGVGLANSVWNVTVDGLIDEKGMIAAQTYPQYEKIAQAIFASNVCTHLANYYFITLRKGSGGDGDDDYEINGGISIDRGQEQWNNFKWAGGSNPYTGTVPGGGTDFSTKAFKSGSGGLFFRYVDYPESGSSAPPVYRMAWGPAHSDGWLTKFIEFFTGELTPDSCGAIKVEGMNINGQRYFSTPAGRFVAQLGGKVESAINWTSGAVDAAQDKLYDIASGTYYDMNSGLEFTDTSDSAAIAAAATEYNKSYTALTSNIGETMGEPLLTLARAMDGPAKRLAAQMVATFSAGGGATPDLPSPADLSADGIIIRDAAIAYGDTVREKLADHMKNIFKPGIIMDQYRELAKDGGWVVAGEWYLQLMKMNATVQQMMSIEPKPVQPIQVREICKQMSLCKGDTAQAFVNAQQEIQSYYQRALTAATRQGMTTSNMGDRMLRLQRVTGAFGMNGSPGGEDDFETSDGVLMAVVATMAANFVRSGGLGLRKSAFGDATSAALFVNTPTWVPEAAASGTKKLVDAAGLMVDTEASNPVAAVIAVGRSLWRNGLAIMYALDDNEFMWKDRGALALLTSDNFVESEFVGQLASAAGRMSPGTRKLLARIGQLMLIPGFLLGYLFPFLPWLLWIGGLVGWLILVIEAVIAAPLWALAHMRMDGEGIMGPAGQQGYMLALSLMLRPSLMLIGLLAGQVLIFVFVPFIGVSVASTFQLGHAAGAKIDAMGMIMMIALMSFVLVTVCYKAFGLIHQVPDRVLRWIGAGSGSTGEDEFRSGAFAVVQTGSIGQIAGSASGSENIGGEGDPGAGGGAGQGGASKNGRGALSGLRDVLAPRQ